MVDYDQIIVHYHEVALKGGNRDLFEKRLKRNIATALRPYGIHSVMRLRGRMIVSLNPNANRPAILEALQRVFGIAYFAPISLAEQRIEAIQRRVLEHLGDRRFTSFKVDTRRSQKSFPMNSMEVNRVIGAAVQAATGAKVDLTDPELTIHIEIFDNQAAIFTEKLSGAGGLPVGTGGKAVSLLSSGIDSPVASFKIMKRGIQIIFVHFHSVPYTSVASKDNVERIVEILNQYQYHSRLYLIPFLEYQQRITSVVPAPYRVIMYRRAMLRMAEAVALRHKALALVTGENVAQVASQTLPNMRAINDVASLPILRPLAGDDKIEIIEKAREIGTYEISTAPYEDCCSLFVPGNPETRANLKRVRELDAQLDHDTLVKEAIEAAEVKEFRWFKEEETETA